MLAGVTLGMTILGCEAVLSFQKDLLTATYTPVPHTSAATRMPADVTKGSL